MAERGSVMVKSCPINALSGITDGPGSLAQPEELRLGGGQPWRRALSGLSALPGCQVNSRRHERLLHHVSVGRRQQAVEANKRQCFP